MRQEVVATRVPKRFFAVIRIILATCNLNILEFNYLHEPLAPTTLMGVKLSLNNWNRHRHRHSHRQA